MAREAGTIARVSRFGFLLEALARFRETGAIAASSDRLAEAITAPARARARSSAILEVGAGTGVMTRWLVRSLGPGDRLDICEINEKFVRHLEELLRDDPEFARAKERIRIIHSPIQEWQDGRRYDFIVSGLPYNNFPSDLVECIFSDLLGRLVPGGVYSFFEYSAIRGIKATVSGRTERRRLKAVGGVLKRHMGRCKTETRRVLWNVPPAMVHHLQSRD